jgi:hypothetical protein
MKGRPLPIDHVFKRKRILKLARKFSCSTFVETGTFYGQMVEAVRNFFPVVLSVELSHSLYEHNLRRFSGCSNVRLFEGDSAKLMDEMIRYISGRAMFWLDGHYSGPGTAKGETECPVMAELNVIEKHPRNDHCILIDDADCFDEPSHTYPKLGEVRQQLLEINHKYDITVEHNCIIALPPIVEL